MGLVSVSTSSFQCHVHCQMTGSVSVLASGSCFAWLELCCAKPKSWFWMKPLLLLTWKQMTSSSRQFVGSFPIAQCSLLLIGWTQSWTMTGEWMFNVDSSACDACHGIYVGLAVKGSSSIQVRYAKCSRLRTRLYNTLLENILQQTRLQVTVQTTHYRPDFRTHPTDQTTDHPLETGLQNTPYRPDYRPPTRDWTAEHTLLTRLQNLPYRCFFSGSCKVRQPSD